MTELTTPTLEVDEARRLTDGVRTAAAMTWELLQNAYLGRAWMALGYASWDDYCETEFATTRLRLPKEDRSEVVGSLRDAGLSVRAIAAATGESKSTIVGTDGKTYQAQRPEQVVTKEEMMQLLSHVPRVLGISEEEWQAALAEAGNQPEDLEYMFILGGTAPEQFEQAIDECRSEGDLSKANLISKLEGYEDTKDATERGS